MAFAAKDGSKHTNMDSMKHADAKFMAKAPAATEPMQNEGPEPEIGDKPVHTMHHAEGGHTTVHESGAEKHHATAEELVDHLKKYLPEEEQEIQHDEEPEFE